MKSAWDFVMLRRSANQAGVVTFAAGLAHGIIAKGDIFSGAVLIAVGIFLIALSILRRYTMADVALLAIAGATPLIIMMIYGLYINR